jgi:hypothetical protein
MTLLHFHPSSHLFLETSALEQNAMQLIKGEAIPTAVYRVQSAAEYLNKVQHILKP